ncbi:helix-turn-helix domain-containing protein [Candidatus Bathyarchaeota archaeon]|nr:helix-turn-helix domain-containing protein [Candidatus Bathyarchaeota archaeon]
MERAEALDIAEATLHSSGFTVSRRCSSRTSCFDFAARKEENLVFIKVLIDIKDISPTDAVSLRAVAKCFDCTSLIISDMNGNEKLSDDTIYSRYDVYVVTSKTLDDIVRGTYPMIEATRGGYFVRLDGDEVRLRRHELGLSIGKLAGMVGISRRALYGYERELTRASVAVAYKLTEILGVPLVKTINILRNNQDDQKTDIDFQQSNCMKNKLHRLIMDKFAQLEFKVTQLRRVPFDFAASCPKTNLRIIGSFLRKKRQDTNNQVEEIMSLSELIKARPVFFGINRKNTPRNVPFLGLKELTKLSKKDELMSLL